MANHIPLIQTADRALWKIGLLVSLAQGSGAHITNSQLRAMFLEMGLVVVDETVGGGIVRGHFAGGFELLLNALRKLLT